MIPFVRTAYAAADPIERPYLLNAWADSLTYKGGDGAMSEALSLWREALRLNADADLPEQHHVRALGPSAMRKESCRWASSCARLPGDGPDGRT